MLLFVLSQKCLANFQFVSKVSYNILYTYKFELQYSV